jgi:hypothetical protein
MACQNFADSSSAGLAYVKQSDCGVFATEGFKSLRFTSSDLQFSAESTQSEEIRSDRNVPDLVRTAISVSGSVGFELSYGDFNPFISAALSTSTQLDGTGTFIKNGVAKTYFTFEDSVLASGTTYFNKFYDCEVDTFTLNVAEGAILTGTMGVMGRTSSTGTTSDDANGYTAAGTNPVYNAVSMVSAIELDGAAVGEVQSLTINVSNNKREQRAIGKQGLAGVGDGQFVVTGDMTIYFANNTLYQKFLADQTFTFRLLLDDATGATNGNQIEIQMPRVKFGNVTRSITGNNQDVLLQVEYQAIYSQAEQATIMVATRNAA